MIHSQSIPAEILINNFDAFQKIPAHLFETKDKEISIDSWSLFGIVRKTGTITQRDSLGANILNGYNAIKGKYGEKKANNWLDYVIEQEK